MSAEYINQEFRLKKIDETRNYLIEEINEFMSKKHKKVYRVLNYIEHLLILILILVLLYLLILVTGWVSISAFASLVGISIGITSSAMIKNLCNNCRN